MNQRNYILLPVNSGFIVLGLGVALLLNMLPWGHFWGVPDFVALTLIFWSIHQPNRVGVGTAFLMGLLMDVHQAIFLGENALAYTLLSYFAITIHRRVNWYGPWIQALHIFLLMLLGQFVQLVVRFIISGTLPVWYFFTASFVGAILWPLVSWILLAPQRRVVNRDDTRPI